jgi:biopolymer transport protein TolQ
VSGHISVLGYFIHAGFVVKSVMFILLLASIASWTLMIERVLFFRAKRAATVNFLNRFWRSTDLSKLYHDLDVNGEEKTGVTALFFEGFQAYWRRRKQASLQIDQIERVMQIVYAKEATVLEQHLPFFASVGSISPYIGLFGTVWGIMTSFQALGQAQQATIAMVAPGISEALVATALGLFTAIPAVIAFNRYSTAANQLLEQFDLFQQELIALIEHQSSAVELEQVQLRSKAKQAQVLAAEVEIQE